MKLIIIMGIVFGLVRPSFAQKLIFLADNYPPYEFLNSKGDPYGFDVEVIQAVFAHLDIPIEIKFRPWKRVVLTTKNGQATGMFSCGHSTEREEFFHFSAPISYTTQGIITKKNRSDLKVSIIKDLLGMTVGAISGYASNGYLKAATVPFFKIPLIENAFPMLLNDRFEGLFLSLETGQFLATTRKIADQFTFIPITDIAPRPYHICFSKKWPNYKHLSNRFNRAFAELQAAGKITEIHSKY